MISARLRKNTMSQVCRQIGLNYKIGANTAMLLRMLTARNRGKLAIDMFLNFTMNRDDLIYLIRLARWNEFLTHCNVNRSLFPRCCAHASQQDGTYDDGQGLESQATAHPAQTDDAELLFIYSSLQGVDREGTIISWTIY